MASAIAKIRFIADCMPNTFRGTAPGEQENIDLIIKEYAPYLYLPKEQVPQEVVDKLEPIASGLLKDVTKMGTQGKEKFTAIDFLVGMYE